VFFDAFAEQAVEEHVVGLGDLEEGQSVVPKAHILVPFPRREP
jgi:hypothetical protein